MTWELAAYLIGFLFAWVAIANDTNPKTNEYMGWMAGFIIALIWPVVVGFHVGLSLMRLGLGIKG